MLVIKTIRGPSNFSNARNNARNNSRFFLIKQSILILVPFAEYLLSLAEYLLSS